MNPQITRNLWQSLWQKYTARVSYARTYTQMITAAGGKVANDHIAFRSLRLNVDSPQGKVNLGLDYLEQMVKLLGYEAAGEYSFPHKHLYARHYSHPQQVAFDLPKLFISELVVDELPPQTAKLIYQTVQNIGKIPSPQNYEARLTRIWSAPRRSHLEQVNKITQYGAWVLIHGYAVNHFTGYVNRQNTPQYPDIDTTASGLAALGVPMKAEIEGNTAIGLRQTATQAVPEMVTVLDDDGKEIQIPWTYAYYEIAQRYMVETAPGKQVLFDEFLGANAQHLFEMTKVVNC